MLIPGRASNCTVCWSSRFDCACMGVWLSRVCGGGQGDELDHKYEKISAEEAEEGWNALHDSSQHSCMHTNCGREGCQVLTRFLAKDQKTVFHVLRLVVHCAFIELCHRGVPYVKRHHDTFLLTPFPCKRCLRSRLARQSPGHRLVICIWRCLGRVLKLLCTARKVRVAPASRCRLAEM